jgi:hypothetical protein
MKAEIKDGKLVITMDYDKKGSASMSGKSLVHASTRGNTPVSLDGKVVKIGVNAYSEK